MTRSIPTRLGLGALLIAFGCDEVFVLGDVEGISGSTGGPEESGGSNGSGGLGNSTPSTGGAGGGLVAETDGRVTTGQGEENAASTGGNTGDLGVSNVTESAATTATGGDAGGATSVGAATSAGSGGSGSATGGAAGEGGGDTICEPGPPPQTEARCCSTGTRTREYSFDADTCMYITSKWSACSVPKECAAGTVEGEILHCSNGMWRERTRACSDTCELGEWVEGECQGNPDTCTGCACVSYCTDPDTGGSTCLWIACSEAEARAECELEVVSICGTRNDPLTFLEWLPN